MDNNKISLPGVVRDDHSSRSFNPEIQTTVMYASHHQVVQGLLTYSLDSTLIFDPYDLDIEITPKLIRDTLDNQDYSSALMQSLRLNEEALIDLVLEKIPYLMIDLIASYIPELYADRVACACINRIGETSSFRVLFNLVAVSLV